MNTVVVVVAGRRRHPTAADEHPLPSPVVIVVDVEVRRTQRP